MKQHFYILLSAALLLALTACKRDAAPPLPPETTEERASAVTESFGLPTETVQNTQSAPENTLSFHDLENTTFRFSSGAGGWQETLVIYGDGSFSGEFHDSNMGSTGDGYPNGSADHCEYQGQFTQPQKVNDYTYSLRIQEISYAQEPGTTEIIDGVLFQYRTPYGLGGAEEILIYLPGAPLAELPQEYRSWVGYYDLSYAEETELPFYGLYNVAQQCGFSSSGKLQQMKDRIAAAEAEELSIESGLGEGPSQADLNIAASQKYQLWDTVLNELWSVFGQTLDTESMRQLTVEELEWIAAKEEAVAAAGAEVEGGSLYPLVTGGTAAEITKSRVYELMELLEQYLAGS